MDGGHDRPPPSFRKCVIVIVIVIVIVVIAFGTVIVVVVVVVVVVVHDRPVLRLPTPSLLPLSRRRRLHLPSSPHGPSPSSPSSSL
jgi:hypothetical protein